MAADFVPFATEVDFGNVVEVEGVLAFFVAVAGSDDDITVEDGTAEDDAGRDVIAAALPMHCGAKLETTDAMLALNWLVKPEIVN